MNAVAYVVMRNPGMIRQFTQSARSLRAQGYNGIIAVVTDLPKETWPKDVDHHEIAVAPDRPLLEVARLASRLEPLKVDHVLKLDTDTVVIAPIDGVWDVPGDISFRRSIHKVLGVKAEQYSPHGHSYPPNPVDVELTVAEVPATHPFYHSGVFCWRRGYRAAFLFEEWERQMRRTLDACDEWALVRAAHMTGIRPTDLPWKYNALPTLHKDLAECKSVGHVILHFYGPGSKARLYDWV